MKYAFIPLLILAVVISVSCSKNPVTPPTHGATHGTWTGFLFMDSIPIGFSVDGDGVKDLRVSLTYDFDLVPDSTVSWDFSSLAIVGDSISAFQETGGTAYVFSITVTGGFDTADHIRGNINSVGICDSLEADTVTVVSTWSASHEG